MKELEALNKMLEVVLAYRLRKKKRKAARGKKIKDKQRR